MSVIIKITFLIVGTVLVALGFIGLYGVIRLSEQYSNSLFLAGQVIVPISLFVIGIFLLFKFYKKTK